MTRFFHAIHEGGHVTVGPLLPSATAPGARDEEFEAAILTLERLWRTELAMDPPALVMPAAVWGVTTMYRACQFLAYREAEAETVRAALAEPCPEPPSAGACYSVDLGLRVLPDVMTLARAASPDDPLVAALADMAQRWPLSSVGVAGLKDVDASPFIDHPSLRRLYADRIIERNDASRLADPRAGEAVREALGGHPNLAPHTLTAAASVTTGDA